MDTADILMLSGAACEPEYLEDTSLRRLILDLYDREQASLGRYLYFLGVDVETARECVQESFLKLQQHLIAGGDRSNLRAWLYRVAHNLARNAQTSAAAKKMEPLPEASGVSDPVASEVSAEESLLARERERVLRKALERLSPAQRESLVLRSQGFKYREIADLLGLSVSTVGENIQRGLTKLKDLL